MRLNYILCPSFHGATLFALLLNNHTRISCIGDMPSTDQSIDLFCSCGEKISCCPQWREVRRRLETDRFARCQSLLPNYPEVARSRILQRVLDTLMTGAEGRTWQLREPLLNHLFNKMIGIPMIHAIPWLWRTEAKALEHYTELFFAFYETMMELHGTEIFIDSSKRSGRLLAMHTAHGLQGPTKVVHLCRDPRGFAVSWKQNVGKGDIRLSSQLWLDMHQRIDRILAATPQIETMLLRYEELSAAPSETMEKVFGFFGLENEKVVTGPKWPKKHHLLGNTMLATFDGMVHKDNSWKAKLSSEQQRVICKETEPLFRAYGYRYEP